MLRILKYLSLSMLILGQPGYAGNQDTLTLTRQSIVKAQDYKPKPIDFKAAGKSEALTESQKAFKTIQQQQMVMPSVPKLDLMSIPTPKVDINNLIRKSHKLMGNIAQQPSRYESQILVFVSSSMPDKTVRNYLKQTTNIDAALVYRGLINNSMKDMRAYLSGILQDQTEDKKPTILIDPTLYERFDIQQVPVIVVTESQIKPCQPTDCPTPVYHRVTGDVSLPWALSLVSRQIDSEALKSTLRPLIKEMEPHS